MAWFDSFRDRVVLVTGASSGIGRATATAFASAGAHVALVARRRAELERLAAEMGTEVAVLPADVTDRAAVHAVFDAAARHFGRIDVVVNNAGVLRPSPVLEIDPVDLEAMLRVNLFGALYVMQAAVQRMLAQDDGVVVNVASLGGRRGVSPIGGYCATKFALVGLTEALREAGARSEDTPLGPRFVRDEWEQVVDAWQVRSLEAYREISRVGRRTWLASGHRDVLWPVFGRVREVLAARGLKTLSDVYSALADTFASGGARAPYDLAIVDEAQDLSVAQLDLERREPVAHAGAADAIAVLEAKLRAVRVAQDVFAVERHEAAVRPVERRRHVRAEVVIADHRTAATDDEDIDHLAVAIDLEALAFAVGDVLDPA